jgi:L-lactate dehydrogenase complex protein LldG
MMNTQDTKNNILKKISRALQDAQVPMPFPEVANLQNSVFQSDDQKDHAEIFAKQFTDLGGKFIYCETEDVAIEKLIQLADAQSWNHVHCNQVNFNTLFAKHQMSFIKTGKEIHNMQAAISDCEALVARLGSLLISSASDSGRILNVYCPVHICIAYANQIVWDVKDAMELITQKYGANLPSMINLATGPSRTADIEKTLVVGVHGPKEVYVLFIDKNAPQKFEVDTRAMNRFLSNSYAD